VKKSAFDNGTSKRYSRRQSALPAGDTGTSKRYSRKSSAVVAPKGQEHEQKEGDTIKTVTETASLQTAPTTDSVKV